MLYALELLNWINKKAYQLTVGSFFILRFDFYSFSVSKYFLKNVRVLSLFGLVNICFGRDFKEHAEASTTCRLSAPMRLSCLHVAATGTTEASGSNSTAIRGLQDMRW